MVRRVFFCAALFRLVRFRQRQLKSRLLFERRRDDKENDQDDENIDERNDNHRRGLSSFANDKSHKENSTLLAYRFFAVLTSHEFGAERFQFDRNVFDLLVVIAPEDQRRDRNEQTN